MNPAEAVAGACTEAAESGVGGRFGGVTEIFGIRPLAETTDPFVGRLIGDVTLVAVIGEGGMGRVYEGRQRMPDRPVAVKVLRPGFITPEGLKRFAREAELLGALRHPNIAQIFWAGACDILGSSVPFIVMEFVPGAVSITDHVRARNLDTAGRIRLFRKVCTAVAHGHVSGIIHRDLKPGNVLIDASGEPKLIDFGIARIADSPSERTALTELGRLVGTVQYMSPEQLTGDPASVDPRTDVYALGLLLHELLTDRRPYEIDSRRVFDAARILRGRKPLPLHSLDGRRCSAALERLVEKCLAIVPEARYSDAGAVVAAIDLLTGGGDRASQPWRRRWGLAVTAAACFAVAAILSLLPRFRSPFGDDKPDVSTPPALKSPDGQVATLVGEVHPATRDEYGGYGGTRRSLTMSEVNSAAPISGNLSFPGITDVHRDVAHALVARGQGLWLDGLSSVSRELAAILCRNRRGIRLNGIPKIDAEIAGILATSPGPLCLDGVKSLDVASARALASHRDWLNIVGLVDLSDAALEEIVRHHGHGMAIRLPGALDARRAEIIARHSGLLYLVEIETVDEEAAKVLAGHRGRVIVDAARLTPEVDRLLGEIQ